MCTAYECRIVRQTNSRSMTLSMTKCANSLWQDCGRNKWKVTASEWDRMSTDAKTLDFARGCNSIQNQLVNFSYFPSFGTVRSEVRILSPRPITHNPIRRNCSPNRIPVHRPTRIESICCIHRRDLLAGRVNRAFAQHAKPWCHRSHN